MNDARQPTSIERMESRVLELEMKLAGGTAGADADADADVSSRLDALVRSAYAPPSSSSSAASGGSNNNSKRSALHEDFLVIDRLLRELDISPISGPTTAGVGGGGGGGGDDGNGVVDATTPMAYRRMEVLANAESIGRNIEMLARIRDLVGVGTRVAPADGSSSSSSSSGVVNCPIVSSGRYDFPSDPDAIDRLDRLCYRVASLSGRAVAASRRADDILNSYGGIVMALSEKMVLAEEQMNDRKIRGG
ncbi:hypothetical protein ACHAW5_006935 [Stephanodiscus triporus]|uniref:Uncharacterized protein n=1 Tax=Stephanodiscus triporus TaxID=2934178 RepID=A0ABD3NSW3_9STRA